jgi:sugar lactone lactonase YvrE
MAYHPWTDLESSGPQLVRPLTLARLAGEGAERSEAGEGGCAGEDCQAAHPARSPSPGSLCSPPSPAKRARVCSERGFVLSVLAALLAGFLICGGARAQSVQTLVPAPLSFPVGIALDGVGNVFVSNDNDDTVSRIAPDGTVSVFVPAGQGLDFPEGLAFDAAGNLYVANSGNGTVSLVTPSGVVSTFVSSGVGSAMGLAFDAAGNLYVADSAGDTVEKVTPAGIVSTFASDTNYLSAPNGLAFDTAGNLYVANILPTNAGGGITKITPAGALSVYALSHYPDLFVPTYLAFDKSGNLFVTSAIGPISEITPAGTVSVLDSTSFLSARGLAIDGAGNLYVADLLGATVAKVTQADKVTTLAASALADPTFTALDAAGNIYVSNAGSRTISKVTPAGQVSVFVERASGIEHPTGLAFDAKGTLYVSDARAEKIVKVAPGGTVSPFVDLSADGNVPQGLAFDAAGNLYVACAGTELVNKVTPSGAVSIVLDRANGIITPEGLAFDGNGNLYVASAGLGTIVELTQAGQVSTFVPASAGLSAPQGLAFDASGTLYVTNSPGGTLPPGIIAVSPSGVVSEPVQGVAGMGGPIGLSFLPNQTLYVADNLSNLLFQVTLPESALPAPLLAAVLPGARSVATNATATVFATVLNTGTENLADCTVALGSSAPSSLTLGYQTTNPTTNQLTGTPNQPVALSAKQGQSFLLSFQSSGPLDVTGLAPVFACDQNQPAPTTPGVDTVDLHFSPSPGADIIALAATAPQPGIVAVPLSGEGAFALASVNVGGTQDLTVTTDTGSATLPVSIQLCPTNAVTGQCTQPMAGAVPVTITAGGTPTFSVFVTASAAIPFAPATSRIFVRFFDGNGQSHGSTSVAVETQ